MYTLFSQLIGHNPLLSVTIDTLIHFFHQQDNKILKAPVKKRAVVTLYISALIGKPEGQKRNMDPTRWLGSCGQYGLSFLP